MEIAIFISIHKRVDTLDTRLTEMEGDLVSNPLEKNLGFYDFGKYTAAAGDADFAFEKINELWDEEIRAEMNSDDEAEVQSLEGSDSELDHQEEDTKPQLKESRQERRKRKKGPDNGSKERGKEGKNKQ
jgi:hypothetical protein